MGTKTFPLHMPKELHEKLSMAAKFDNKALYIFILEAAEKKAAEVFDQFGIDYKLYKKMLEDKGE